MKFKQEYIAENLYENLKRYFKNSNKSIKIAIEGKGVHWNCNIVLNNRKSKIHCFEDWHYKDVKPEYLISFEASETNKAWGRTYNIEEAISSSAEWISNKNLDFLYKKYEFVEWYKRRIEFIEQELISHAPELKNTERLITTFGSGLYDYNIIFKNRSCLLTGYGVNEPISFKFLWDKCMLFEVKQNDLSLLAAILKKWLVDKIAPSKLENQYNRIEVGEVAKYYEKGEGIKGEFLESWNSIERFYQRIDESFTPKVLELIKDIRAKGFDTKLRAGQSLYNFILSRSRRHGLRQNQVFIKIRFELDRNEMIITDENNMNIHVGIIEYSKKLERLLEELAVEEIN